MTIPSVKVWIDLDNTPHVPFFIPIKRELERRGHRVVVTARDAFQVCELADQKGVSYVKVGRHYGKHPFMKVAGLLWRSTQLAPFFFVNDLTWRCPMARGRRSCSVTCFGFLPY